MSHKNLFGHKSEDLRHELWSLKDSRSQEETGLSSDIEGPVILKNYLETNNILILKIDILLQS